MCVSTLECVLLFIICDRVASVNIDVFNIAGVDLAHRICIVSIHFYWCVRGLLIDQFGSFPSLK